MKDQLKQRARTITTSQRTLRVMLAAIVVAIVATFVVGLVQSAHNRAKIDDLAAQARARGQALGTANAKLTQNGIAPVTPTDAKPESGNTDVGPTTPSSTPKAERGRQGEVGAQGPGPTTAQVSAAVESYCDAHSDCTSGPTKAQVAAAVLTYCAGDKCKGDTGASGVSGAPGQDATGKPGRDGKDATGAPGSPGASGQPGRAPTSEEIAAAVASYCSDGACRGPAGPAGAKGDTGSKGDPGASGQPGRDGSDGKSGADAPHFTKIQCQDDNSWLFTLSDGSTLTAAGPCRASETTVTVTAPPTSPDPTSTAP